MAQLFGVTVPNISYHFKRIFSSGELEPEMVIKEILITAQSGVRGLSEEKVKYYNLDAILSLGYSGAPMIRSFLWTAIWSAPPWIGYTKP